jgi:hypothetical protein
VLSSAAAVVQNGSGLDLSTLPAIALELSGDDERQRVAELISTVAHWRGFGTSTATKVLHKKRPTLIPILDNQAIFGAYLKPRWPGRPSSQESVYGVQVVRAALDRLAIDLIRPENRTAWESLARMEPARSRIELFDMVWWMYFRELEPVRRSGLGRPASAVGEHTKAAVNLSVFTGTAGEAAIASRSSEVTRFQDDDDGYRRWLAEHPHGFVINCERRPRAGNLKLHRATCSFISRTPLNGRSWTGPYIKVCAIEAQTLAEWGNQTTGMSPAPCPVCRP